MDTPPAGIQRFPVELFERVFLCLTVPELVRSAHVCRYWRELAFDSPAYWDDIIVDNVEPNALSLAEHRIRQGGDKGLSFEVIHKQKPCTSRNDPVVERIMPMIRLAVARAWHLEIFMETMYRPHTEEALCGTAPNLRSFAIRYYAEPFTDMSPLLGLCWDKKIFAGQTGKLRCVHLYNIVLPLNVTAAFHEVDEIWFQFDLNTRLNEFPSVVFKFFPKATRARLASGNCLFPNVPLPQDIITRFRALAWVDLEFPHQSLPAFFEHLPLDDLNDLLISGPDEDHVYRALEPLLSFFHLDLYQYHTDEFIMSIKGSNSERIRRFAEPLKYYYCESPDMNALLENEEFMEQLSTLSISVTLWSRLHPWLQPSYKLLPRLIIVLNGNTPVTVALPTDIISFPMLSTLVIQVERNHQHSYVSAQDLIAFVDRNSCPSSLALELRRVYVTGSVDLLRSRFSAVDTFATTIEIGPPYVKRY